MMKKVKLNKIFYQEADIKKTIDAFSKIACIKYCDKDEFFSLEIEESKFDPDVTLMEFENYLIALSNKRGD